MREFGRNNEGGRRSGGDRFGGGRSRDRFRRDSGRSERRSAEMFNVVCDKCGKECTVPFKPTNNKPVFCSDCFRKDDAPRFENSGGESRDDSGQIAEELAKINEKLDKILQTLNVE